MRLQSVTVVSSLLGSCTAYLKSWGENSVLTSGRYYTSGPSVTHCGCDFTTNRNDTNDAVADVKKQLDELAKKAGSTDGFVELDIGQNLYSIKGSVVAFLCVGYFKFEHSSVYYKKYLDFAADSCGDYVPVTWVHRSNVAAFGYGFMNYDPELNWCETAEWSTASSC